MTDNGMSVDGRRATVLVVDDDEDARYLLACMLKQAGCSVTEASDGAQALAAIAKSAPDVVLLDLLLPGIDGYEVTRRMKREDATKDIPIVAVTGVSELDRRMEALDLGADEVLVKPVHERELVARVRTLLQAKAYRDMLRNRERDLQAQVEAKTRQLQAAFDQLHDTALEMVFTLTRAAEYRDDDTAGHIQRMAHVSALVARRLGLPAEKVDMLLYASAMHDIGKIGVPDAILLKPGKLDTAEWEIMKGHAEIGAKILSYSEIPLIAMAQSIALTHHEKWDGSGYPRGLKGEAIPIEGRITAIADVFDALTSRRPYKEPLSVAESLEIIRVGRGKHFDPAVAEAFLGATDEVKEIRAQFSEEDLEESRIMRLSRVTGER